MSTTESFWQQFFSPTRTDRAPLEHNQKIVAEKIANHFAYTRPSWIFGIPDGGIGIARHLALLLPDAKIIRTKKLSDAHPYDAQLTGWQHPHAFPVYSHKDQRPRIVAWEEPSINESILIVDNVFQFGLTAEDTIGELLRKGHSISGFGVGKEYYPESLNKVANHYGIPVFAVINGTA